MNAPSFDQWTTVVNYGGDTRDTRAGKARWILWPALAYKVIAPFPRRGPFNLFQESILKMCQAGVRDIEAIALHLALPAGLVGYILEQLQSMDILDSDCGLTHRAVRVLEDARAESCDPTAGYVFQNAFDGELWPFFAVGSLVQAAVIGTETPGSAAFAIKLQIGSIGHPWEIDATSLLPSGNSFRPPTSYSILAAYRQHRRALMRSQRGEADFSRAGIPPEVEEISIVSDQPQPVFLTTFLSIPRNITRGSLWQIWDPFGLGASIQLRQQVERLIAQGLQVGAVLKKEIKNLTGAAYAIERLDLAEILESQQRVASEAVLAQLGPEIRKYPVLYQRLVDLEESVIEARRQMDKPGAAEHTLEGRIKEFMRRASAALEELFSEVQRQCPAGSTLAALSADAESNAILLEQIARMIGLRDDESAPLFDSFLRVCRNETLSVTDYNHRDLRQQFAVLLAAANDLPSHPLYRLAREYPDCVSFLVRLKSLRNRASHGAVAQLFLANDLETIGVNVYRCVRGLLLLVRLQETDGGGRESEPDWQLDVLLKLRASAAFVVEDRLGISIRDLSDVQGLLVEMQMPLEELCEMPAGSFSQGTLARKLDAFLLSACSALEAGLRALLLCCHAQSELVDLTDDKLSNAKRFSEIARSFGFDLARGALPSSLVMVKGSKIKKALRRKEGTLNSLTLALLLSAENHPEHPLRSIACACPDFLLAIADLSERRKHGVNTRVSIPELPVISDSIYRLIAQIIHHT